MAAMTTDTPTSDVPSAQKTAEETSAEVTTSASDSRMGEDTNSKENIEKVEDDVGTDATGEPSAEAVESTTTPLDTTDLTQSKTTPLEATPFGPTQSKTTPCNGDEMTTETNHITSESVTSEAMATNVTSENELKTSLAQVKPRHSTVSENSARASTSSCEEDSVVNMSEGPSVARSKGKTRIVKGILTPAKRKRSPSPDSSPQSSSGYEETGSVSTDCKVPAKKRKRRVSFDGVTVFYFRRSQGFTSVPSQGGSTLGMSSKHENLEKYTLAGYALQQDKAHRRILKRQMLERRQQQLVELGCTEFDREISDADLDEELKSINVCDYYFLQPIPTKQRRQLLRTAGVKKIDNLEKMELKRIRASRESCGCDCRVFCDPETCACSIAGIKCQVDRLSFPCGCTKDGCGNHTGRIEFNPARVRTHFIHTLMRIDIEKDQNGHMEDTSNGDLYGKSMGNKTNLSITESSINCMQGSSIHSSEQGSAFNENSSCMSSSLYSGQPGFSGSCYPAAEGNMEIKQGILQDPMPRMLHFSDSDDDMTNQQLESQCNVSLPPMPPYDSSEESYSSSSSESSGGENYQYMGSSNFGLASGASYGMIDDSTGADLCMPSISSNSLVTGGDLPVSADDSMIAKLTPLESTSALTPITTCTTLADLSPTVSCSGGGFGDIVSTSASSSCDMGYGTDNKDSMCNIPSANDLLATNSTQNCSSSSGFPVLSAMNAIDQLEEMRETALATSSISSVTVGMGDQNEDIDNEHLSYSDECENGVIGQIESEESDNSELACTRGESPCLPSDTCDTIGEALLACRDSKLITNHSVPLATSVQQ